MPCTESEIIYQVLGEYGYSIEHILMVDIIPDEQVRKAMNEINAGNGMYQQTFSYFVECLFWFFIFQLKKKLLKTEIST